MNRLYKDVKHFRHFSSNVQLFLLTASREPRQNQTCFQRERSSITENQRQPLPPPPTGGVPGPRAPAQAPCLQSGRSPFLRLTCPVPSSAHSCLSALRPRCKTDYSLCVFLREKTKTLVCLQHPPAVKLSRVKRTLGRTWPQESVPDSPLQTVTALQAWKHLVCGDEAPLFWS